MPGKSPAHITWSSTKGKALFSLQYFSISVST